MQSFMVPKAPLKRPGPPESPNQILKKRRLAHVKEALEMIKSKVAYDVLTEAIS